MRIDGPSAVLALERESSLRVEPGTRIEITCLSGVLWLTQAGDGRDLFLGPGESLKLSLRGVTVVTALEPAAVRVVDCGAEPRTPRRWWAMPRWLLARRAAAASRPQLAMRASRLETI